MRKTILLGVALLGMGTAGAQAQSAEFMQQAQSACLIDVMSLCSAYIPDQTSITSCMQTRRTQLSAPCRKIFDAGMRMRRQQSRG